MLPFCKRSASIPPRKWSGRFPATGRLAVLSLLAAGCPAARALEVRGWGAGPPVTFPDAAAGGVTAIAAGTRHSVALKGDGTVTAWGDGAHAIAPAGLTGVTAIAAGEVHTVALKSDGTVTAWGSNSHGQTSVPAGLTGVVAVAAGDFHTVALKSDGSIIAWGANVYGQCTVPPGLTGVRGIRAAGDATYVFLDSPLTGYETWAADRFSATELALPALSGPSADPDGDGLPNAAEYVLGQDPRTPGAGLTAAYSPGAAASPFALTFERPGDLPPGASCAVEESADHITWSTIAARTAAGEWTGSATVTETPSPSGAGVTVRVHPAPGSGALPSRLFLRLKATTP